MKGSYFLGSKQFEVREMEQPLLAPNEVLIKVKACGICGTDVHIYHGEKGSAEVEPPVVLGHEFSGEIVAIGENVNMVEIGDHVTMDPNMYCGKCRPCRMGKKQNCEHLNALGVNVNGGFAEYAVAPEEQCYIVDNEIEWDVAAMAEPLACAIHGIDRAQISLGQNVLIIGGGTIGLLMAQLAKLSGTSTVIVSEPIEMRRKIALEVGADAVIDPVGSDFIEEVSKITGTEGADVVIECVGSEPAVKQAIAATGKGGKTLLFSVPKVEAKLELNLFDVFKKELTIMGSIINPDTHQRAVNLIDSRRLEISKLITHKFDLYHLEDAIKMQMSNESIKVMIHPWT